MNIVLDVKKKEKHTQCTLYLYTYKTNIMYWIFNQFLIMHRNV